ncbi:hypothetical protein RI367_000164 [Sorochytrium milnesiophthora]
MIVIGASRPAVPHYHYNAFYQHPPRSYYDVPCTSCYSPQVVDPYQQLAERIAIAQRLAEVRRQRQREAERQHRLRRLREQQFAQLVLQRAIEDILADAAVCEEQQVSQCDRKRKSCATSAPAPAPTPTPAPQLPQQRPAPRSIPISVSRTSNADSIPVHVVSASASASTPRPATPTAAPAVSIDTPASPTTSEAHLSDDEAAVKIQQKYREHKLRRTASTLRQSIAKLNKLDASVPVVDNGEHAVPVPKIATDGKVLVCAASRAFLDIEEQCTRVLEECDSISASEFEDDDATLVRQLRKDIVNRTQTVLDYLEKTKQAAVESSSSTSDAVSVDEPSATEAAAEAASEVTQAASEATEAASEATEEPAQESAAQEPVEVTAPQVDTASEDAAHVSAPSATASPQVQEPVEVEHRSDSDQEYEVIDAPDAVSEQGALVEESPATPEDLDKAGDTKMQDQEAPHSLDADMQSTDNVASGEF